MPALPNVCLAAEFDDDLMAEIESMVFTVARASKRLTLTRSPSSMTVELTPTILASLTAEGFFDTRIKQHRRVIAIQTFSYPADKAVSDTLNQIVSSLKEIGGNKFQFCSKYPGLYVTTFHH